MTAAVEDRVLLADVLALDTLTEEEREAFENMVIRLEHWGPHSQLTEKQRSWAKRLLDIPEYENAWSLGKVPRGREVPTPPALQNLPKRPPGGRA
jgi:hypothetical protein